MPSNAIHPRQLQALRLINHGGKGLTEVGNAAIGREAKALLAAGLISYVRARRWVAYGVTVAGHKVLEANQDVDTRSSVNNLPY